MTGKHILDLEICFKIAENTFLFQFFTQNKIENMPSNLFN